MNEELSSGAKSDIKRAIYSGVEVKTVDSHSNKKCPNSLVFQIGYKRRIVEKEREGGGTKC